MHYSIPTSLQVGLEKASYKYSDVASGRNSQRAENG